MKALSAITPRSLSQGVSANSGWIRVHAVIGFSFPSWLLLGVSSGLVCDVLSHQTSWVLSPKDLTPQLELPSLLCGLRLSSS